MTAEETSTHKTCKAQNTDQSSPDATQIVSKTNPFQKKNLL